MGEQDFYVAADDENWYRSHALDFLDSLGIESRTVNKRSTLRFIVDGVVKEYDWSSNSALWFIVLYDGRLEPKLTRSVELASDIGFMTGG